MKTLAHFAAILILFLISFLSQHHVIYANPFSINYYDSIVNKLHKIPKLEIPKIQEGDQVIYHLGYAFLYNETHEQSSWVAYELTSEETHSKYARTNQFIPDPDVLTGTAQNIDYENSGYDKGHLAPAGDMGWSETAMKESFYFSNMSPQVPAFNRGIWKKLEGLMRVWALDNGAIYIITGPILTPNLPSIGINHVSIPEYYYKVILDYSEPEVKGIGFILPNKSSKNLLLNYAVSIDSVESLTGIDFFYKLANEVENDIEKTICIPCWKWESNSKNIDTVQILSQSHTRQCKGITKTGKRCKNKTTDKYGYCHLHEKRK